MSLRLAVQRVERHNFDSSSCCRGPIHVLARSASSLLAWSAFPARLVEFGKPVPRPAVAGGAFEGTLELLLRFVESARSDCRTGQRSRLLESLDRCSLVALTLRDAGFDDSARQRQHVLCRNAR